MKEISIVIPVYNSEECLQRLYAQIQEYVTVDHEVILVNDQSQDGSWDVIKRLAERHNNIIGIDLRMNKGQDNAIMAGLSRIRGKYVVIMDDDLQHPPSEIMNLYAKCQEGYDVCYGSYALKHQSFWKNIGSWFNGKVAQWMLNKPHRLYLSPFKIMRREIAKTINQYYGPYPYLDGLILNVTNTITQIEVTHNKRFAGKGNYSPLKSLIVWSNNVMGFSVMPLRFTSACGFIVATCGFLLSVYYIFLYFWSNRIVEGWTTLVVLILFIGGTIMMALGIIGEYVGRSYFLLNHKPQYNIKEMIASDLIEKSENVLRPPCDVELS